MAKLNIQPLGDRVLVQAIEEKEQMRGGLYIPDSAKEKPMQSKVVAVGPGKVDDNGKRIPVTDVKVGDIVLTSKYGGTEVKYEEEEYKILNVSDILAIIG